MQKFFLLGFAHHEGWVQLATETTAPFEACKPLDAALAWFAATANHVGSAVVVNTDVVALVSDHAFRG